MLSKIAVFKKKIEIDDDHNRLGPCNSVNKARHNALYFDTNLYKLKLLASRKPRGDGDRDGSSSSSDSSLGSRGFRSKIAQNDAIMN